MWVSISSTQTFPLNLQVRLHPILKQTKTFVSSIRRREQLVSGFPLLSNTGVTLTQSVINLLYKLQEKQPWAEAVGLVRGSPKEMMLTVVRVGVLIIGTIEFKYM